jgi:hypothetical protein
MYNRAKIERFNRNYVVMGKNNKPILSVLVDEDKKEQFADLARRNKQSMGWVLNACIDRMLEADSIALCTGSIGDAVIAPKPAKVGLSVADVEELIKTYIDGNLQTSSIDISSVEEIVRASIEPVKTELIETVKVSIGNIPASSIDTNDIQKMVNESIEVALEPISVSVSEAEDYTKSQIEKVREELMSVKKLLATA